MPLCALVSVAPGPTGTPGMSDAFSRTICACGASTRKTMRRSSVTSGETTCGPCGGAWAAADAATPMTMSSEAVTRSQSVRVTAVLLGCVAYRAEGIEGAARTDLSTQR